MISLGNQEALLKLKEHKKFADFLEKLDFKKYPGLNLEKVFLFISSGVLIEDMPLSSSRTLMNDIKIWLSQHSHGGLRKGTGAPKKTLKIKKITLSAEEKDIAKARNAAKKNGCSLQSMFREWLKTYS